jgi:hypothetical protein
VQRMQIETEITTTVIPDSVVHRVDGVSGGTCSLGLTGFGLLAGRAKAIKDFVIARYAATTALRGLEDPLPRRFDRPRGQFGYHGGISPDLMCFDNTALIVDSDLNLDNRRRAHQGSRNLRCNSS